MSDIKESANLFIEHLRKEGKSNSTLMAYGKDIEQFLDFLKLIGVEDLNDIQKENIKLFLEKLAKEKYTIKSVSRKLNSIRTFCKIMNEMGITRENPAISVSHPKIEPRVPRVLSEIEYRALRDVCRRDQRLFTIVELMLQTGIRIGELARLQLEEVELKKAPYQLFIREYDSNNERYVPLNKIAVETINDYLKERYQTENNSLFITKTGRPLLVRNIRTGINKAFQKAGIQNAKVNDLRNTFIAHNLAKGADLVKISQLVGHKRISTTEKYLGLVKKDKKSTKLEEL
jgi:site-specific recombinase XerD